MAMKKIVIRTADVPAFLSVFAYIKLRTNIDRLFRRLPQPLNQVHELPLTFPVTALQQAAEQALTQYGSYGWLSSQGRSRSSYQSLSLTHNPNIRDPAVTEFNSTLGSSFIAPGSYFYGNIRTWLKLRGRMKNSYYDSYAFNQPNTVAREQFGDLFGHFKRTVIRSRLSVIRAGAKDSTNPEYLLHRDEPVYENIRINIPLTQSPDHYLQYRGEDINLKLGKAYTWDTNQPHRVHGVDGTDRTNLVLGFSPWFDYDAKQQTWISNEYYGECHPIEMVQNGWVADILKVRVASLNNSKDTLCHNAS
jgi:hypothetical protein